MFRKIPLAIFLLFLIQFTSCSSNREIISYEPLEQILKKPLNEWTLGDCNKVIKSYSTHNERGYSKMKKMSANNVKVYITAVPLHEQTIKARVKKEALVRRYTDNDFILRLKEELEFFTNKTVDINSGKIILKSGIENQKLKALSFDVNIENITDPIVGLEMYNAELGFFIESKDGKFGRVTELYSHYYEDYFILYDQVSAIFTFSLIDDSSEKIYKNDILTEGYQLVFNGLSVEPVILKWF